MVGWGSAVDGSTFDRKLSMAWEKLIKVGRLQSLVIFFYPPLRGCAKRRAQKLEETLAQEKF